MSKDNIKTTYIEGDLSVGEDLHIGGNATQHGDSHIKGNVKIEGWLDAPNVKSAYKGFFICEADLVESYPTPQAGWWAVVGDTIPGPIYISVKGKWTDSGAVGGLTGEEIHIAKELGQNDYAISQKAVTNALASKLEVINAEPYFRSIPDFSDNKVVTCNVNYIPYGPRIAYEFPDTTPKPLLVFYDSKNTTSNTFVYKGFMTDPLKCIIITFHKNENKATIKVINIPDESNFEESSGILLLEIQDVIPGRLTPFNETIIQTSQDGVILYCLDTNEFIYRHINEDGVAIHYKKWYNSYLYNDESEGGSGNAKSNILIHVKGNDTYVILKDGILLDFLNHKINKSDIATTLGDSEKKVISQKAVTDALANKTDKTVFETKLKDKLSVIDLSPSFDLDFWKTSESNDVYKSECPLSKIFENIDYKNVIFTIFNPLLIDNTTSNVIILSTGKNFCFSFAKYLQGKYYYDTTASNLEFYKEGEVGVFKKYTSALITLVLDIQENILELHFEDANNFEKLEVEKDNYKIVIDPYFIYSQHGGNDRYNTPQMYLEPQRLSVGSPYSGEGAVLYAINENKGNAVETVYLSRNVDSVDKEGIKLSGGKVKFYHNIDDVEELPINVTGVADPIEEYDAVNKKYVDTHGLPIKVTHAKLVEMVNAQTLIEGQEYEITDYEATAEPGAAVRGDNQYLFNIIVKAMNESKLSYDARCSFKDGDSKLKNLLYNSDINAWQIKYQLKPDDVYIFDWTDPNGKGTIFWLKDDVGNEAPFDFYNFIYKSNVFKMSGCEHDIKLSDIVCCENYAIADAVGPQRLFNNNNRIIYEYAISSNNRLCCAMIGAGISKEVNNNTIVITSLSSLPAAIIPLSGGIAKYNHVQDSVRSIVCGSFNIIKNSTLAVFRGNHNYITSSTIDLVMPNSFVERCNIINGTLGTKTSSTITASRCDIKGTLRTHYNTNLTLTNCSVKMGADCTEDGLNITLIDCDLINAKISSATPSNVTGKILYNDAITSYDEIFGNDEPLNDNIKTYTYRDKIFLDEVSAGQRFTMAIFSNSPLSRAPQHGDQFRIITDVKDDMKYPESINMVSSILIYHNNMRTLYPFVSPIDIMRRGTIVDVVITSDGKAKVIYNSYTDPEIGTPLPTKLSELENDTNFAQGISVVTIHNDEWVDNPDTERWNYMSDYNVLLFSIKPNERVIIDSPVSLSGIYILPISEIETASATYELVFATSDTEFSLGTLEDIVWAKEPVFNPNKVYAVNIELNKLDVGDVGLAMYAEFDTLNMEEV